MKKIYLFGIVIIAVIGLALTLPFGSANVETKHYENGEVSFDYPATWQEVPTKGSHIVAFEDPENGLNVTVSRQVMPEGYKTTENFVPVQLNSSQSTLEPKSQKVVDLNWTQAHDNLYKIKGNDTDMEQRELWINANGALYSVIYQYSDGASKDNSSSLGSVVNNVYEAISPNSKYNTAFDIVKNSINIDSTDLGKKPVIGSIYIPSLGVEWDIRTDTLNAAGSVYKYPESFYPGQNGTVGLIGHHTKFSAPFADINTLKVGDKVIIYDYLTQKKYTYQVILNGDINWDYKVNPVDFPEGKSELKLATCWPPGYMSAAWIVHCELISIEPIT